MAITRLVKYLNRLMPMQPEDFAGAVEKELDNLASHALSDDPAGVSGTFKTADTLVKTITVVKGIITSITQQAVAGGGDVVGDDVSTTVQNIVAYSTTGGKNVTELTGTRGDVLYHNGTSWVKLAAGASGTFLKSNGAGADPSWAVP